MGTRSTVKFYDESDNCIASIYQQYDGYPSCVGLRLAQFLARKELINGFGEQKMDNFANGIGCLSAQFIAEIKTRIGNVYMTYESDTQDYDYVVKINNDYDEDSLICDRVGALTISVDDFKGNVSEFLEFCQKNE